MSKRTYVRLVAVMEIGTPLPHLLVEDGRALAPESADDMCLHHLDILPFFRGGEGLQNK